MSFKKKLKRFVKGVTLGSVLFYGGINSHIAYDYNKHQKPLLEKNGGVINSLEYRKYTVNVDGVKKDFTLIGETHMYNQGEYNTAKELVKEHTTFANECGYGDDFFQDMSKSSLAYGLAVSLSLQPYYFYFTLASGREFPTASDIAYNAGEYVYPLENNNETITNLSSSLKVSLLFGGVAATISSPLAYYTNKQEDDFEPSKYMGDSDFSNDLIVIRDKKMADSIVSLLEDDKVSDLLVNIGRGHINGVHEHLGDLLELEMTECNNCSIDAYNKALEDLANQDRNEK